jgi:hypothetical protein
VVCRIGAAAGVVVARKMRFDRAAGKQIEKAKYGSAHDFCRSFCFRWALRVAPLVLKELARHESVSTTERYYIGQNSDAMADVAWAAWEQGRAALPCRCPGRKAGRETAERNTFDNSRPAEQPEAVQETTQAPAIQGLVKYARQDSNLQPSVPKSELYRQTPSKHPRK